MDVDRRIIQLSNEVHDLNKKLEGEITLRKAIEKRLQDLEEKSSLEQPISLSKEIVDAIRGNLEVLAESDSGNKYPMFLAALKKSGIDVPSKIISLREKVRQKVKSLNNSKLGGFEMQSKSLPLNFVIREVNYSEGDLDTSVFNVRFPF